MFLGAGLGCGSPQLGWQIMVRLMGKLMLFAIFYQNFYYFLFNCFLTIVMLRSVISIEYGKIVLGMWMCVSVRCYKTLPV